MYVVRDAAEWENYKSIFHSDAYIYTTWSGRMHYADFITVSQRGMDNGAFIMHRCHGITTDITQDATRAVTKMKATISQRFTLDEGDVDVEADCRFCFFWAKVPETPEWRAVFVRHWYEKDKLIPVDPRFRPEINDESLKSFPNGYRYLGYCQEKVMGVKVAKDMPGHLRDRGGTSGPTKVAGENHDKLYWLAKAWLDDGDTKIFS